MNFRTPPKPVKLKKKQEQEEPPKPINIKVEIFKTLQSLPLESLDLDTEGNIEVSTLNEGDTITLTENSAIILKNSKSYTVSFKVKKDKKDKYKEWFESKVAELSEDRKLLGQKICRDMLKEIASIALTPVKSEDTPVDEEDDEDDTASALAAVRASKTKVVEVEDDEDDSEISEDVTENSEVPFDVSEDSSTENWDDDIEED